MTNTIDTLEQKLATARAEQQAELAAEVARRDAALVEHSRRELAAIDLPSLRRQARDARQAFEQALMDTPAFASLLAVKEAEWAAHQAGHDTVGHQTVIARAEGKPEPRFYDGVTPLPPSLSDIENALGHILSDRLAAAEVAKADRRREAAETTLTPEQLEEIEQEQELARRRAQVIGDSSTDVTDMTDAQRVALGLPPGSSRTQTSSTYR